MIQRSTLQREAPFYIESDGKPMGETPQHIDNMIYLLEPLKAWFADDARTFVAANMFVHYERGKGNRHISPDLFVVKGVLKEVQPRRRNYRVWEEGKGPDFVVELTSESTRDEDRTTKHGIYQDVLRVSEYFLFDPFEEYLHPRLQGYRLAKGIYQPIRPMKGRLPSKVLGLHMEADGELLRLYDPSARRRLPIPPEVLKAQKRGAAARKRAEKAWREETRVRQEAEAEVERLRRELDELRRRLPQSS